MPRTLDLDAVRVRLELDRTWAAFSLADLEPVHQRHAHWFTGAEADALVLVYRAYDPPIVYCQGTEAGVGAILDEPEVVALTASAYLNVMPTLAPMVRARFRTFEARRMVRMVLGAGTTLANPAPGVERLDAASLDDLQRLYANERPAFFLPSQLETGVYFGVREAGALVAVAGTHVVSAQYSVGAIGNVHTRPDSRGRGLAGQVTSAVAHELRRMGASTIVLNIVEENAVARRVYERIGFRECYSYFEGVATR